MSLQTLLDEKQMTRYQLSKLSGVPKTTINDICSGKSSIEKCTAKTLRQIATALECSMETIMGCDSQTEKEIEDCMEYGLPDWLVESIKTYTEGIDSSIADCLYCELQSDINVAEVEQLVTSAQAWHLREKYLGIKKG